MLDLEKEIAIEVHKQVLVGVSFTAHDITTFLRNRLADTIHHNEVRNYIHKDLLESGYFTDYNYERVVDINLWGQPLRYQPIKVGT